MSRRGSVLWVWRARPLSEAEAAAAHRRPHGDLSPVKIGVPTPAGRTPGDCTLCRGDVNACDCQLHYTSEPGSHVEFNVSRILSTDADG